MNGSTVIKKLGRRNLLQPHSEYIFTKRSLFVLLAKITKHPQWKVRAGRRLMFGQDDESVIDDKRYIVLDLIKNHIVQRYDLDWFFIFRSLP